MTVRLKVEIDVKISRLGQYDRLETHVGQREVSMVDDGLVRIGGVDEGIVFAASDLAAAVKTLEGHEGLSD